MTYQVSPIGFSDVEESQVSHVRPSLRGWEGLDALPGNFYSFTTGQMLVLLKAFFVRSNLEDCSC